jgi:hypothetical protein
MIMCEKYISVSAWDHATDVDARIAFSTSLVRGLSDLSAE